MARHPKALLTVLPAEECTACGAVFRPVPGASLVCDRCRIRRQLQVLHYSKGTRPRHLGTGPRHVGEAVQDHAD
jgi:hypothetical protein